MKSGCIGLFARASDADLLDCLHDRAFPKHALDGISIEESLRATASSVTVAANAADMPRFVRSLFDYMRKFVADTGSTGFFTIDGDVNGLWKPAPARLFTRAVLDTLSPDVFKQACTYQLIVNDKLHSRPMHVFFTMETEAEIVNNTSIAKASVHGGCLVSFSHEHPTWTNALAIGVFLANSQLRFSTIMNRRIGREYS